jgi:hypothetical protein
MPRPSPAAEQIMQLQRRILERLEQLTAPEWDDKTIESAETQDLSPVTLMVELLKEIAQALKTQRELLEIMIGYLKGAPGSKAALDAALLSTTE